MSEQPPIDQTHGYNDRASEAIAAMPKNEQGLPVPNESAYNQSQLILESDPQAMARSQEMEQWSDKSGKYAENAASLQSDTEKKALDNGQSAEELRTQATETLTNDTKANDSNERLVPQLNGMLTANSQRIDSSKTSQIDFVRSPSKIGLDAGIVKAAKKVVQ